MFKRNPPRVQVARYHVDAELQVVEAEGILIQGYGVDDAIKIIGALYSVPEVPSVPDAPAVELV